MSKMSHNYEDMLEIERPVSSRRSHLSSADRAAQFSAFAALTGFDDAVRETARLTDTRVILDENEKALLNEKLMLLQKTQSLVILTYFKPDESKAGGSYVTISDQVKKIDLQAQSIQLEGGTAILIEDVIGLDILAAKTEQNRG